MKLFIKTFTFHLLCILLFTFVYNYLNNDFELVTNKKITFLDSFLLSTATQSGVGSLNMYPNKKLGKIAMIIQQLLMISTNVFTIYMFTL